MSHIKYNNSDAMGTPKKTTDAGLQGMERAVAESARDGIDMLIGRSDTSFSRLVERTRVALVSKGVLVWNMPGGYELTTHGREALTAATGVVDGEDGMLSVGECKARAEAIVGRVVEWDVTRKAIQFRADHAVTLKDIIALSESLGTDAINFDFGNSGSPGYSEMTPGSPGSPGYVEIVWPIPAGRRTDS